MHGIFLEGQLEFIQTSSEIKENRFTDFGFQGKEAREISLTFISKKK